MRTHKKAALRKAPGNAFDTALGLSSEQLADLHLWCSRSYQHAADRAQEEWNVKLSISQLCRWFHRNDRTTLLKMLGSSAALATDIVTATEGSRHDTLLACETAITALAMKQLAGEVTREEMELALELFRVATASRSARDRKTLEQEKLELARQAEARAKETLEHEKEKYRNSVKEDFEKVMDAFAEDLKGNTVALAAHARYRAELQALLRK
jgi:hypothetical protein